ncbi:unnamed protein product, partial [Rotaria sp. Silwood2]
INKTLEYLLKNSSLNKHSLVSSCYNDLGSIYTKQSNYSAALQSFDKAISINNDDDILSKTYLALSDTHFQMTNYRTALEYLDKSLDRIPKTEHLMMANVYINMGKVYMAINEPEKASKILDKALECQLKEVPITDPDVGYSYNV